ncbi:MAG: glyceraldehyde 3-phosphate dehydrogenase NAD-binding domain-containing protein [bacterium]|nr:glyceraldehyde 3-phosphate dehydrogenase NAD-binding domain-containing protein [bacterium]
MKKIKVGINGLGRIGRAFLRAAAKHPEIEVVAVNDLGDKSNMDYLLKYDSVFGNSGCTLEGIKYLSEKEPSKLPWGELGVDVVVESTGFFASAEKSQAHLDAGAKRVVISAPLKEEKGAPFSLQKGAPFSATVLMGLNEERLKDCVISSNASCTTNAASPVIAILDEVVGIEKAVLNTVHAYTATQTLVDGPAGKKGFREGRAAAANIIPSSTGAAVAVTKAYPSLEGKFDGISLRVPVICGSIADITFIAKRDTSVEEVNAALTKAAKDKRWQGIFAVAEDELVSSDILGRPEGAIAELSMTRVVGGNLVKVLAWYDNESGYAAMLVRHVIEAGKHL